MRRLLLIATLALLPATPPAAQTPEAFRACEADRRGPGCATLRTRLFSCGIAPAMAGCAELIAARDQALAEPAPPLAEAEGACPVIEAADWTATLGPVAGAEGPHLVVEGTVTLPTPGWTVTLSAGIADRAAMPVQRVILTAEPPTGMVAQVLTDYALRLEMPALAPAYRGVVVDCAGLALVEVGVAP